jgi:ribose/xylose/arabinose/galactoside ABC-type transport system permease subunit
MSVAAPPQDPASPRGTLSGHNPWATYLDRQEAVLAIAALVVVTGVSLVNPGFFSADNFVDILQKCAYIAIAAIGTTLVILCGHIDISIGAAVGLCATVAGKLAVANVPLPVVFLTTILVGGLIGLINGLLVSYVRIPAIVVTLGTASILKGGLILVTGGRWIYGLPQGFDLSHQTWFGVPVPIFALIVFGIGFSVWLRYTSAGRKIYAVGGNAEAARLSGISERHVTLGVFALNGLLVGVAAVLYATNFSSIQASVASGLELTVITAAVVGGVSILGGSGTVVGAIMGAILLQIIGTAMVFLHVRAEWFQTIQGSLILMTILLDVFRRRKTVGISASSGGGGAAFSPRRVGPFALQEVIVAAVLVAVMLILSYRSDRFFTAANLLNQTRFLSEIALMAVPMTFIIITGGIDLSVGSVLAFSSIVLGFSWQSLGLPLPLAICVGIAAGTMAGFLNGLLIVRLRVPPLIVTLATLAIFRGLSFGISESRSVHGFPEWFGFFGSGEILRLPVQLYLLIIVAIVSAVLLARTPLGRTLYAIGNNETAARFSGLNVNGTKLFAYTLSGFMAGLAGLVFTSRVTTTRADAATGIELDVIAAVVFGGTSIFGGRGTILGTILGVITIQLLKNGLQLSGVRGEASVIVIGIVLILSIIVGQFFERRPGKRPAAEAASKSPQTVK